MSSLILLVKIKEDIAVEDFSGYNPEKLYEKSLVGLASIFSRRAALACRACLSPYLRRYAALPVTKIATPSSTTYFPYSF
jgi:hypothetical protein